MVNFKKAERERRETLTVEEIRSFLQRIEWDKPLTFQCAETTRMRKFKELFGDNENSAYNLRHTFATICQEQVRQEIVEIWIGDSPQRLIGKHYTHFFDEFMKTEMSKVQFPTL